MRLWCYADGRMSYRGADQRSVASFWAGLPVESRAVVRLVPDRNLPALTSVNLTRELRNAGAQRVLLVTQRGLQ